MLESLELIAKMWWHLPREQKLAVILLSTSLPLGLLSVGVGIYSGSSLLLSVGLVTLATGVYAIVHVGWVLIKLVFFLIKFFLKLPFVLLGMMRHELRENVSDLSTGQALIRDDGSSSVQKKRQLRKVDEEPPSSPPVGWFDFVFGGWGILALIQIHALYGFFFGV